MAAPEGVWLGIGVGLCTAAEGVGKGGLVAGAGVAFGVSCAIGIGGVGRKAGNDGKAGVAKGDGTGPIAAAISWVPTPYV